MSQVTLQDLWVDTGNEYQTADPEVSEAEQRPVTVDDLVAVLQTLGATIKVVGEPGYYDHHGNDDAFIAAGSYLVWRVPTEEDE